MANSIKTSKINHEAALKCAASFPDKISSASENHYISHLEDDKLKDVISAYCYSGALAINQKGIYLHLPSFDVEKELLGRLCFDSPTLSDNTKIPFTFDQYESYRRNFLKFVLDRRRSPWRKIVWDHVLFKKEDQTPYLVYLPFTSKSDGQFVMSAMTAIRMSFYAVDSVIIWNQLVEKGIGKVEAFIIASAYGFNKDGDVVTALNRSHNCIMFKGNTLSSNKLKSGKPTLSKNSLIKVKNNPYAWVSYSGRSYIWESTDKDSKIDFMVIKNLFTKVKSTKSFFKKAIDLNSENNVYNKAYIKTSLEDFIKTLVDNKDKWCPANA